MNDERLDERNPALQGGLASALVLDVGFENFESCAAGRWSDFRPQSRISAQIRTFRIIFGALWGCGLRSVGQRLAASECSRRFSRETQRGDPARAPGRVGDGRKGLLSNDGADIRVTGWQRNLVTSTK